jgi:hypothetical protein
MGKLLQLDGGPEDPNRGVRRALRAAFAVAAAALLSGLPPAARADETAGRADAAGTVARSESTLRPAGFVQLAQAGKPAAAAATRGKDDEHRREDIVKHRQMARAHEDAARCLEAGEKEAVCQERLRDACKGIAVGRYCGMRHGH